MVTLAGGFGSDILTAVYVCGVAIALAIYFGANAIARAIRERKIKGPDS